MSSKRPNKETKRQLRRSNRKAKRSRDRGLTGENLQGAVWLHGDVGKDGADGLLLQVQFFFGLVHVQGHVVRVLGLIHLRKRIGFLPPDVGGLGSWLFALGGPAGNQEGLLQQALHGHLIHPV